MYKLCTRRLAFAHLGPQCPVQVVSQGALCTSMARLAHISEPKDVRPPLTKTGQARKNAVLQGGRLFRVSLLFFIHVVLCALLIFLSIVLRLLLLLLCLALLGRRFLRSISDFGVGRLVCRHYFL